MIEDLQNQVSDKLNPKPDLAGGLFDSCHHYQVIVRLHRPELLKMSWSRILMIVLGLTYLNKSHW